VARAARPNIPGGVYHVMARGNERKQIYLDDEDRERFLDLLKKTARRCQWECLAYCLMGNHYHLVVRTPLPNLSRGMRLLNGGYASRVNARYQRVGHLFQGRYRSVLIRSSDHLLMAIKYVLRNPVVAGLCSTPADWRWSSYQATLAYDQNGLVASDAVLVWFGDDDGARRCFARFMSNENVSAVDGTLTANVQFPCEPGNPGEDRPSIEEVLACQPGASGIALAYHEHGYSLAEIAGVLGCSRPSIGRKLVAHESREMLDSGS
jgi:REP element-mobilizing transposase RayT